MIHIDTLSIIQFALTLYGSCRWLHYTLDIDGDFSFFLFQPEIYWITALPLISSFFASSIDFGQKKRVKCNVFVALSIKALDVESESFHAFHTAIGKLISELIFMYTLIKSTNWLLSCQSFHFDSCVTTFSWSRKTIFVAE